jgi:poly(hydroxyalkanoate) depolymerase family esterase
MKLNEGFLDSMREAMMLLRTRGPAEATEIIQRALRREPSREAPYAERTQAHGEVLTPPASTRSSPVARRQKNPDVEDRCHFDTLSYSNAAGRRQYRLFVPTTPVDEPKPLIVMLHGCTQNADDFAAGTQMNTLAAEHGLLVAYPIQPQQANPSKCWNWFKPADQQRDSGEPSIVAGITRDIIATHAVDPARVYIAGLSAGGAMAAVMIDQYPDLYAAAGIHSGLPAKCAHDLPSALAAMKGGAGARKSNAALPARPVIVFHGDADATVDVANAARLVHGFKVTAKRDGETPAPGHRKRGSTVTYLVSSAGVDAELWTVHGAPHAWAGGDTRGSFTDPAGPNASAEMLRFFLDHPKR